MIFFYEHGRASVGRPVRSYLHMVCVDIGCSLEDHPEAMFDWDGWRKSDLIMMIYIYVSFFLEKS